MILVFYDKPAIHKSGLIGKTPQLLLREVETECPVPLRPCRLVHLSNGCGTLFSMFRNICTSRTLFDTNLVFHHVPIGAFRATHL